MSRTILEKATLILASLTALAVGVSLLGFPLDFYASNGVVLSDDINLVNDLRGFGGGLVASALLIGLGLFVPAMLLPSLTAATLIYFGFGLARVFAILLDGVPAPVFLVVMGVELAIAAACLALAYTARGRVPAV